MATLLRASDRECCLFFSCHTVSHKCHSVLTPTSLFYHWGVSTLQTEKHTRELLPCSSFGSTIENTFSIVLTYATTYLAMDVASVCCTRSAFTQCASRLNEETAWELRTRRDALGTAFQWLEATFNVAPTDSSMQTLILVTAYIVYHPDFCVPQLGFFTSSLLSLDELHAALPKLSFMNAVLETSSGAEAVSKYPLVSYSWNDEAQQHMWLVHSCDTEHLVRRSRYDGAQGDLLSVFIQAMATYFPFAPALLPPA